MTQTIKPTIGRKVWLWVNSGTPAQVRDAGQPIDATIVFLHEDGKVALDYTDHAGGRGVIAVELRDPTEGDAHDETGSLPPYATWMPYQMGQAKAQAAENEASTSKPVEATAKPSTKK